MKRSKQIGQAFCFGFGLVLPALDYQSRCRCRSHFQNLFINNESLIKELESDYNQREEARNYLTLEASFNNQKILILLSMGQCWKIIE